jgi:ABC-type transporter Mla MlaB component
MTFYTPHFALAAQLSPGGLVVKAVGRLVVGHGADPAGWQLCLGGHFGRDVTLDLSEVTALDGAGSGVLASLARQAMLRGGRVRVVAAHARVRRVLALVGLSDLYENSGRSWAVAA